MSRDHEYLEYGDLVDHEAKGRLWWRVLGWVAVGMSAVMVLGSLTAYGAYRKLQGNIHHEDVRGQLGSDRPAKLNKSLNILLIGNDGRQGANAKYGKAPGKRSDTMILLHISPGGKRALGVSFPRDSMVQLPECKTDDGKTIPAHLGMINSSYNTGGPGCTWRTIESLTDIRIDHFVEVDFTGFKHVINALGGVQICLPEDVNDPKSNLHLSKGKHIVKGEQALAYVRDRHGLGDGSDLDRIKRQQKFLAAVVSKATSKGVLTNPKKLYSFLDAATKSVTTDKDFTVDVMRKIAGAVKGMSTGKVRFVTVPVEQYPPDHNRVQWSNPSAKQLFSAIRNDNRVQKPQSAKPVSKVPPSHVKVRVLNATSTTGLAQRVADQLTARGYTVLEIGNRSGAEPPDQTELRYGSGAAKQAAALAKIIPGSKTAPAPGGGSAGIVNLIIGPNWQSLKGSKRKTSVPKSLGGVKASDNVCKKPD